MKYKDIKGIIKQRDENGIKLINHEHKFNISIPSIGKQHHLCR